jgi:NAD(P)-dependent dehydrogenase (short-subunit alcohol dehydrogenase family)
VNLFRVDGHVAAVTGAATGIGRAVATGLAQAGADVAVLDLPSTKADAAETMRAIEAAGRRGIFIELDLTKMSTIAAAIDRVVADLGRIDILVNDAGTGAPGVSPYDTTEEIWDRVFAVNLKGAFFASMAAAKHMRANGGGRIVNVTSGNGMTGNPHQSPAYVASKAGVIGLTRSLAIHLIGEGISVNCVGPGWTETPMLRKSDVENKRTPETIAAMAKSIVPLGRRLQPEDVAAGVIFLCLPAAVAAVGEVLIMDGGTAIR